MAQVLGLLVICLVLLGSSLIFAQEEAELGTSSLGLTEDAITTTSATISTEPSASSAPSENCGQWSDFDLTFVNRSQHELLSMHDPSEGVCELDTLLDRILPPDYEVARNFDLTNQSRVAHINETFATLGRLRELATNYSHILNPVMQRVVARFSFLVYELQLSPGCLRSLLAIGGALNRNEMWAMKLLDSSGRVPNGFLEGVLSSAGDYEQCLDVRGPDSTTGGSFVGQYCWAQPVIPHPMRGSYRPGDKVNTSINVPPKLFDELVDALYLLNGSFLNIALCLPSTCSAEEVQTAINTVLYPITQIPIRVGPECVTKSKRENIQLDFHQQMALCIFAGLICLTVLASIYEQCIGGTSNESNIELIQMTTKNGELGQQNGDQMPGLESNPPARPPKRPLFTRLVLSFSLVSNTRAMFRVSPNKFAAIDFIRFLMLVQIIIMHQYYVALGWSAWPLTKRFLNGLLQQAGTEFKYAFLRNIHNTDFFFALTGLLLAYSTLRNLERSKGRFNYATFVVNMYFRFYPAVFGTILLFYLLPLASDGPFWHLVDSFHVESCRRELTANMLTYNFYLLDMDTFYRHSMCNISSWWVNSCFHLILLSPLLLIPLHHSIHSLWLVVFTILAGSGLSVGHIWWKGIPFMNQIAYMNSIFEESFYSIFYSWPFIHHIGPFVLGILTGYLIRRRPNIYLCGAFGESLLSVVFVALSAFGFYWTQQMLKSPNSAIDMITGTNVTPTYEVFLNITVGKLMFCVGFLWIFYLCCTNRCAWLTRLCTWPGLQPIYSLSLGLYLTNFIPTLYTTFSTPDIVQFTDQLLLKNACFNFVLTVLLSYVIHVLFEKPVVNVLKIIESG